MRSGDFVAGYAIVRTLGTGGTGTVYLAREPRSQRGIALKLLHTPLGSPELARGFARETEITAHLNHPHIVAMMDRGVEAGTPWIAMEYIDGPDPAALPGLLPIPHAVGIATQLAVALDYAHTHSVLHRDVKPANVLLGDCAPGEVPHAYLSDFAMARLRSLTMHLTPATAAGPELSCYSPEQLRGMEPDERSDQYSLACTVFWLLTGRVPFPAPEQTAITHGHLNLPVPRVSSLRDGLPMAVDDVFSQALAKRPEDRFFSCTDFAQALLRALPRPQASPAPAPARQPVSPRRRPRRLLVSALAAALLLIATAATAVIVSSRPANSPATGASPTTAASGDLTVPKPGDCIAGRRIGIVGPVRVIDCARPEATLLIVRTETGRAHSTTECAGAQIKIITVPTERNTAAQSCAVATLRDGSCYAVMSAKYGFEYDPGCTEAGAARFSHRIAGRADTRLCAVYTPPADQAAAQEAARVAALHFADPAGPATYCFRPKDR